MPAITTIRKERDGLSVRVIERYKIGFVVWTVLVGGGVSLWVMHFANESRLYREAIAVLCVLILVREALAVMRGTDVVLTVNNLELTSRGRCPEDGYTPLSIPHADILSMEYREESGGGDFPTMPAGLYVVHHGASWNGMSCVLPNLNEVQTAEVIQAIYRRFPDTGTLSPTGSFEPYLTSLHLNRP